MEKIPSLHLHTYVVAMVQWVGAEILKSVVVSIYLCTYALAYSQNIFCIFWNIFHLKACIMKKSRFISTHCAILPSFFILISLGTCLFLFIFCIEKVLKRIIPHYTVPWMHLRLHTHSNSQLLS